MRRSYRTSRTRQLREDPEAFARTLTLRSSPDLKEIKRQAFEQLLMRELNAKLIETSPPKNHDSPPVQQYRKKYTKYKKNTDRSAPSAETP